MGQVLLSFLEDLEKTMNPYPPYVLRARLRCWGCKKIWVQPMPEWGIEKTPCCGCSYMTWLNHPYVILHREKWPRCKEFIKP